ncbi:MAG: glucose-6-phosphate isomerase family protein [Methanoculleaceae archaeon]
MGELRGVLAVKDCDEEDGAPVYWMYRNLAKKDEDREWFGKAGIRYDITVIPAGDLCGEFVKTKGHYHSRDPAGVEYPEIYEVLMGSAWYLLQNHDGTDVRVVEAREGDRVVLPPGFGHITINPGKETLIMGNLVAEANISDYTSIEERQGGAFYAMKDGWVKNPNYPAGTELRWVSPVPLPGVPEDAALYDLARREELVGFLTRPGDYPEISGILE